MVVRVLEGWGWSAGFGVGVSFELTMPCAVFMGESKEYIL